MSFFAENHEPEKRSGESNGTTSCLKASMDVYEVDLDNVQKCIGLFGGPPRTFVLYDLRCTTQDRGQPQKLQC